jgi:hypothetical protein
MLGLLPCSADKGQDVITETHTSLQALKIKDQPLVQIIVFNEGVDIVLPPVPGNKDAPQTIVKSYALAEIAFLSAIQSNARVVGFIIPAVRTQGQDS